MCNVAQSKSNCDCHCCCKRQVESIVVHQWRERVMARVGPRVVVVEKNDGCGVKVSLFGCQFELESFLTLSFLSQIKIHIRKLRIRKLRICVSNSTQYLLAG